MNETHRPDTNDNLPKTITGAAVRVVIERLRDRKAELEEMLGRASRDYNAMREVLEEIIDLQKGADVLNGYSDA